jgi:rhamnogalacturonyl hydrolase YesR
MNKLKFDNITIRGDLAYRIIKSYARLEGKLYKPEAIFAADQSGWPADWEGRTILALVLLSQASGREPAYLEDIMDLLYEKLNEKGYLGEILPENEFDEQQLSGHNWLLRALLEYYKWRQDKKILNIIHTLVNNLYLPLKGKYRTYPTNPKQRIFKGEAAGNLDGSIIGNWHTSTDIGCAYLSLDGLSQYYEIFKEDNVKGLLIEMIETFMNIDFINLSMQTHSSLSAIRGIIRFYEATNKQEYLDFAIKLFNLYITEGMTENYANYNWFGRPTWTEPCAIVDSYLIAIELFKNMLNSEYLEIAQKIYYNGLGYAQRPNGGFGCDICAGANDIYIAPNIYEAYWCCSMRGGEGLSRHAENLMMFDQDDIYFIDYNNGTFKCEDLDITVKTNYPVESDIHVKLENVKKDKNLKFFIPSCYDKSSVVIKVDKNKIDISFVDNFALVSIKSKEKTEIEISFDIKPYKAGTVNINTIKKHHIFWHGVLLLGALTENEIELTDTSDLIYKGKAKYCIRNTEFLLSPIIDMIDLDEDKVLNDKRQILFK